MLFETEAEVLAWYVKEQRIVDDAFVASIPWQEVKNYPLDPALLPILVYMRDVERYTEVYYQELLKTPTAKEPAIRDFLERWSMEEPLHGDLLHQFMAETGAPVSEKWFESVRKNIPWSKRVMKGVQPLIANAVGKDFAAVHMTWGAVQEFSTLNGYDQLVRRNVHPVLTHILRGILREEARHAFFYWSIARIKLMKSKFPQQMTRFLFDRFWDPVGQDIKSARETNMVISTLFGGEEGVRLMDQRVNSQLERLPGMEGLKTVTHRVASIAHETLTSSMTRKMYI